MLELYSKNSLNSKNVLLIGFILLIIFLFVTSYYLQEQLLTIYQNRNSIVIKDRNEKEIFVKPNQKGYWTKYTNEIPPRFKELLIKKEDQYFYYHFGLNPWSTFRATIGYFGLCPKRASSTITQQLVKILLEKEFERGLKNKIIETFYTLSLEIFQSKNTILKMYVNTIYFGNQTQGLAKASQLYFNLSPDLLSDGQILQLLAAISSPSENNPATQINQEIAFSLANRIGLNNQDIVLIPSFVVKENIQKNPHFNNAYFELSSLWDNLSENNNFPPPSSSRVQKVTLDKELNEKIRKIVERNIEDLKPKNAKNGSVLVIKLPENELLSLIGSPDPQSFKTGYKINMLNEPRPIGSTIKPFIYLKAFEKGIRPYTLVDDREYKYITAIGFPLYPKNFDYKYRGEVNLHYALSNSLNVPTVKVLEYVGLEDFYNFLEKDLEFKPVQDLDNYQLGIALGALEMNLLDLSKYFTIFPNNGILREVKIYQNDKNLSSEKRIAGPEYIQLINRILNDRKTGIEQFGLISDFNLFQQNYALKTGTSRDFHDSWVIGYTPDFLVGVWMGNADNTSMEGISGQVGAGRIWAETMEVLFNSEYNKKTPFEFNLLKEFYDGANIQYGLPDDKYEDYLNALKKEDLAIILNPHQGDVFLLEKDTKIFLEAKENVRWFINDEFLGEGQDNIFSPKEIGTYQIEAQSPSDFKEMVEILISE